MEVYYVYILTNTKGTLYIGITSDLERRVYEHRHGIGSRFTAKYEIHRFVYFEEFGEIQIALSREKELKKWRRSKKIARIESMNPKWQDLSEDWFDS